MAIYLVQHGRCHPAEIDPDRRLTDEGRADVEAVAAEAAARGVRVAEVFHSGKTRALETADIMARHLCGKAPKERTGLGPNDPVAPFAEQLRDESECMYVGHLPFLERLVSCLITGSQEPPVVSFTNGGIVCLDIDPRHASWVVRWVMVPAYR